MNNILISGCGISYGQVERPTWIKILKICGLKIEDLTGPGITNGLILNLLIDELYQNKRCSAVFKQPDRFDGQPYYLDGNVFWEWYKSEEDGIMSKSYYTGRDSCVTIEFPYTPKTEYVFVPTEQYPNEVIE